MTSLPNRPDVRPLATSFQQWLQQGEHLYQATMQEYRAIESQMEELERRLAAKLGELNQIGTMLSKPAADASRKPAAGAAMTPSSGPNHSTEEIERTGAAVPAASPIARTPAGKIVRTFANGSPGGNGA